MRLVVKREGIMYEVSIPEGLLVLGIDTFDTPKVGGTVTIFKPEDRITINGKSFYNNGCPAYIEAVDSKECKSNVCIFTKDPNAKQSKCYSFKGAIK